MHLNSYIPAQTKTEKQLSVAKRRPSCLACFERPIILRREADRLARRAKIGGVALPELNALELRFLFALDFDLALPPDCYARRTRRLLRRSSSSTVAPPSTAQSQSSPPASAAACGEWDRVAAAGLPLRLLLKSASMAQWAADLRRRLAPAPDAAAASTVYSSRATAAAATAEGQRPAERASADARPRSISAPSVEAATAEPDDCLRPEKLFNPATATSSPTPGGPEPLE